MQIGRISLFLEGKFILMHWGFNFRSTSPKEIGAVRNIMLTESNIRFKNIPRQTQFTLDNTTDQKSPSRVA